MFSPWTARLLLRQMWVRVATAQVRALAEGNAMGTRRLIMVGEKLRVPVLATPEAATAETAVTVSVTPAAVPSVPQGNVLALGGVLLAGAAAVGATVKFAPRVTAAHRLRSGLTQELDAVVTEEAEAAVAEAAVEAVVEEAEAAVEAVVEEAAEPAVEAAVEEAEEAEEAVKLVAKTAQASPPAVEPVGGAGAAEMLPVTSQVS